MQNLVNTNNSPNGSKEDRIPKLRDANSKGQDLYFELEQKSLEDIAAKKIILKEYQNKYGQQ